MRNLILGVCLMAGVGIVAAQEPPSASDSQAFEVATVKVNKSGERGTSIRRLPGGRLTVTNAAARGLVAFAYQVGQFQLVGGPSWLDTERYDITAKMEGNPEWEGPGSGRPDPNAVAMRALLVERFKLKLHTETRELDAYALVMLKPGVTGPALKPSTTDCTAMLEQARQGKRPPTPPAPVDGISPCSIMGRFGQMSFDGFPMSQVATMFVNQAGRPVVDRTGLTGNWRFLMTFAQEQRGPLAAGPGAVDVPAPDPNAPSFFTALQEQLGLKLESTRAPLEVTVIDAIERPTED